MTSVTDLPVVTEFVHAANRRNHLRTLFIREDDNAQLLPQLLHEANLRMNQYTLVHSDEALADWLVASIGPEARLISCKRLICGPSSPVHLLEVGKGSRIERYVLRVFVDEEWLEKEPDLARHEAVVLQEAHGAGLPAPRLIAFSADSSVCGHPAVLMSYLGGQVDITPDSVDNWLSQMAEMLAMIHHTPAEKVDWRYFSFTDVRSLRVPSWSKRPDLWKEAINIRLGERPQYEEVFLHRDYHPVNILWTSGELTGVVDWVNACRGPAGVDVAHCCINLATMFGPEIASRFRTAYCDVVGHYSGDSPYWDIDSILDWANPQPGFYPPWVEFGLQKPEKQVLFDRFDDYLAIIMSRT